MKLLIKMAQRLLPTLELRVPKYPPGQKAVAAGAVGGPGAAALNKLINKPPNLIKQIMQKIVLNITGMHCESCAKLIKMELAEQQGVIQVEVDDKSKLAVIDFNPTLTDLKKITSFIADLGYQARKV